MRIREETVAQEKREVVPRRIQAHTKGIIGALGLMGRAAGSRSG